MNLILKIRKIHFDLAHTQSWAKNGRFDAAHRLPLNNDFYKNEFNYSTYPTCA